MNSYLPEPLLNERQFLVVPFEVVGELAEATRERKLLLWRMPISSDVLPVATTAYWPMAHEADPGPSWILTNRKNFPSVLNLTHTSRGTNWWRANLKKVPIYGVRLRRA
jgi:hypothetical protein